MYKLILAASDRLCQAASFFFAKHPRLGRDFSERLVNTPAWGGSISQCPKKIWVQAASLGEAQLAISLACELATQRSASLSEKHPGDTIDRRPEGNTGIASPQQELGLLLTACTPEGKSELLKGVQKLTGSKIKTEVRLFPFFSQSYMRRAIKAAKPDLVVLLETELWPGLLLACSEANIPLLVLNARMSERSFKRYRLIKGLWRFFSRQNTPAHICAISPEDGARYAFFFGQDKVSHMHNIKFDRAASPENKEQISVLKKLLPPQGTCPVLLLASVRAEEEALLQTMLKQLRQSLPELLALVVPKHLERVTAWHNESQSGATPAPPTRLRSKLNSDSPANPGETIIWDSVGELSSLYSCASSTFVGGSLLPLGGQNFLEALSHGLKPFIGPHWKNFAWVGQELFQQGLVIEVNDVLALEQALLKDLQGSLKNAERQQTKADFAAWLSARKGGSSQAARLIVRYLLQKNTLH